jgi:mono/diheme cytochrome c family protein
MNTSKQVNAMIGLMFLVAVFYAANVLNEPNRQEAAGDVQTELFVERGAEIFVANCRGCHGLDGLGLGEGAIAPVLNTPAYLILGEDNPFGAKATPAGDAQDIRDFLGNTIACGRTNSVMPTWSEQYGGSLSDRQIEYLVTLITEGRWDLVEELGHEADSHQIPPATREDVLLDGQGLSLTASNCGQYNALTAKPFRERDPFVSSAEPGKTPEPGETPEPSETPDGDDPSAALVQGLPVGDYYASLCVGCHGANREGGVGLPLTRDLLTQPDDFYIDTITNGRAGTAMQPSGGGATLTPEEIQAIVTWLKNTDP